jgi:ribosome biogenesis GTPase A
MQKVKERIVNVVGKVMKNQPRKEVATKVDISGPVENPQYSTLQIISRIVQNTFFKAILPGFESSPKSLPAKGAVPAKSG